MIHRHLFCMVLQGVVSRAAAILTPSSAWGRCKRGFLGIIDQIKYHIALRISENITRQAPVVPLLRKLVTITFETKKYLVL